MADAETQIRDLAARRHLPAAYLERWLRFDPVSQIAILDAATTLKLRTGQLAAVLDLFDEISVREKCDVTALLKRPSLRRLIEGSGSAPERAHAFLNELRALRFPRLREMTARLETAIAELRLPRSIAVLLPRELASDELTIQLKASDARELDQMIETLKEKHIELARIFAIIGGSDEI